MNRPSSPQLESVLDQDDLIPDAQLDSVDADAFRHQQIAGRVAELACATRTPCNIALYGPWGSGKSSFHHLLTEEVGRINRRVPVVRYDAWKYGGVSLKRNFISNAATQLGIEEDGSLDGSQFHGGLHQSTSKVKFDPLELLRSGSFKRIVWSLLVAVGLAAGAALAWAVCLLVLSDDMGFSGALQQASERIGTTIFAVALGAAVLLRVFDGANVEVQQSAPSEDDEFSKLFKKLIDRATKAHSTPLIVFFIDELDRCAKRDVVSTLTSLRTFLDQPSCVFIVAADREVLEEALDALEQETPVREDAPYYSSASAFLDKIFQYQFSLPPLRSGRLTWFARSLVDDKGGLWRQLREHDSQRLFNDVLYALVPAHVSSPRRVKVLLNSFATNARVAEARGIDWLGRATEIAKLTALQVEFPRLAADLHIEPRLPSLLIDPPLDPSDRQQTLIDRHSRWNGDNSDANEPTDADESAETAPALPQSPDRLLAGTRNVVLRNRQYDDLIRYLKSRAAAGAPDPDPDLLYLEVVGASVGLDDPELGQLLEGAANDPDSVIVELADRPVDERISAARVLGRLSENEFGRERVNMITALTGAVQDVDPDDLTNAANDLVANLTSYLADEGFDTAQLAGAFVIAIAAGDAGQDLTDRVLDEGDLLEEPDNVARISRSLRHLDPDTVNVVAEAAARFAETQPEIVMRVARQEPPDAVQPFLQPLLAELKRLHVPAKPTPAAPVATTTPEVAVSTFDAASFVSELLAELIQRGAELGDAAVSAATTALRMLPDCERSVGRVVLSLADNATDRRAVTHMALHGLRQANPADWEQWAAVLEPTDRDDTRTLAARVITGIVTKAVDAATESEHAARHQAPDIVRVVLASVSPNMSQHADRISKPIETELATPFLDTDDNATRRVELVAICSALRQIGDTGITEQLDTAVVGSLRAAAPPNVTWDELTTGRLILVVRSLPDQQLQDFHALVDEIRTDELDSDPYFRRVELATMCGLTGRGLVIPNATAALVVPQLTERYAKTAVGEWLTLGPHVADVIEVLKQYRGGQAALGDAITTWAAALPDDDRMEAFLKLFDADAEVILLKRIAAVGVSTETAAVELKARMNAAGSHEVRKRIVDAVELLEINDYRESRPVAEAALALIESPSKSKVETAAKLLAAAGSTHRLKTKIVDALQGPAEQNLITDQAHRKLAELGYLPKKKNWRDRLLGR